MEANMFRFVVLLCAVLALAKGQTTPVNQCTVSSGPLPINAYIGGCSALPCHLPQLENALIRIIFRAPHTMHDMRTLAVAYVSTNWIPLPVPYPLGEQAFTCNFLDNTYCPVLQDEVIQYTLNMYIDTFMLVDTQAAIEFRIVDENSSTIMCIRVPIRITPPRAGRIEAMARNATIIEA